MTHKRSTRNAITRKKAMGNLSHQNAEDEVNTIERGRNLRQFPSGHCLRHFMKKLKYWQIDDHRLSLLRTTPFGRLIEHILELDVNAQVVKLGMNVQVVDALLDFWDEKHCGFSISGAFIPFSVDDFALITGLPNRGLNVFMEKMSSSKSAVQKFGLTGNYLDIFGVERKLDLILYNKNDLNPEEDKLFVQLMILYLWVCVMFPPARHVPSYMLSHVENLDAIGSFNWAEALHTFLVNEICLKYTPLLRRIEEQRVSYTYINCLSFAINIWLFEHVNFGEDSRPSNPDASPRMLKWVGGKIWEGKDIVGKLSKIGEDKVSLHLAPRNEELELVSHPIIEHMTPQTGCSDDAERENPSLIENCIEERVCGMSELCEAEDREVGCKALDMLTQKEIDELSVNEHPGTLKGRYVLGKKKEVADNQTYDQICRTKKSRNASGIKRRRKHVNGKKLRPSIKRKQLMITNRREISNDRLSVPGIMLFEKKDCDMPVNIDDYPCPIEQEVVHFLLFPSFSLSQFFSQKFCWIISCNIGGKSSTSKLRWS
ncbi:hypothetical protein AXF42_Ash010520 [Apostasia shenzhenica]|uniref:Aminotransferase-like plant mobile domain-containing protein n=1 Tax=Apostasia shenzhenica TaxID=1088818 RepID=A0A2I0A6B1_9ASPA|nr:hypothetical protein AXF42_Ash010520 [Apostasia shenzhenica]